MDLQSLIVGGASLVGIAVLAWLYNRKSIQSAIRKRERDQQIDSIIKNQKANKKKFNRDQSRKKRVGRTVDPDKPWAGVRGKKTRRS
nr:hypothetical protein 6 [bacterium]